MNFKINLNFVKQPGNIFTLKFLLLNVINQNFLISSWASKKSIKNAMDCEWIYNCSRLTRQKKHAW